MKTAAICKSTGIISDDQLEKINSYSRRPLKKEEVFVFPLILCDNEVDRDLERFTVNSLEKLGELFLGSTGVFDHTPKAENQSARIFDTMLEISAQETAQGEKYVALKAFAYMVRCEKNADLILEIDGGIKKEISVGCAVESVVCSVCGEDQRSGGCTHQKGETYGDKLCYHLLVNPTDAYEWSFVAVPAQKRAGVTKRLGERGDAQEQVVLSKSAHTRLQELAKAGRKYEEELRKNVVRLGLLSGSGMDGATLSAIAGRLDIPCLEAMEKSFGGAAGKAYPLSPQLCGQRQNPENDGSAFKI